MSPTSPSSPTKCFYMLLSKEGRRQRGSSDEAASRACWGWTHRQTYPPLNLWGWEDCQVHCLVDPNGERRQSKISCPLWGAVCIGGATLLPPRKIYKGLQQLFHLWSVSRNPNCRAKETSMVRPSGRLGGAPAGTGGGPHFGVGHWEAKLGDGRCPHPCPCSYSGSHPQSKSLVRCTRSPSQHRPERWWLSGNQK